MKGRTYGLNDTIKEDIKRCRGSVWSGFGGMVAYQCSRRRGFGDDKGYCKQHAKKYRMKI